MEVAVEPEAVAMRADGYGGDRRDSVVVVAMNEERGLAPWRPGAAHCWNEQKAALVQEHEVRPQARRFFLISTQR